MMKTSHRCALLFKGFIHPIAAHTSALRAHTCTAKLIPIDSNNEMNDWLLNLTTSAPQSRG